MNHRRDSVRYGANSVNPPTSFWTNDSGDAELLFNNPPTRSQNQGNDQQLNVNLRSSLNQVEELLLAEEDEPNLLAGRESWSENGYWGSHIFQHADTEIQNLSARNSSGKNSSSDNWSRVSDAFGNSWNSTSASPTPLASSSSQDCGRIKLDQLWNIDQVLFEEIGDTNNNNITIDHDDQIQRCPAPLPNINTDPGNQQAEKRKGFSSPNNLSDKSMSSEGDADDASLSEGSSGDKRKTGLAVEEPEIGMVFLSEEEAYEFYRHYASQIGFRVRKGKVQRLADQTIRKRLFYCSKEGFRSKKESNKITKYTRKETRTGCEAMIQVTVDEEKWVISKVVLEHNHDLPDSKGRLVHARDSVQTRTSVADEIGPPKPFGMSSMVDRDYIQGKKSSNLQAEDCRTLENYLSNLQAEDQSFFVELQVDHGTKQMPNFFWRDSRSKMDYYCFGDVLVLDTAFRMDKYDMICAAFFGLNHHQQPILFGCAFLIDETKESLVWLLRIFMEAMGRREPKTVFTDEGQQMADAIKLVLPQTKHCLGTWCICQNAPKQLSKHFEQPGFKSLFYRCIFDCHSREEFESSWDSLVKKYKLQDNSWVQTLYRLRHQWSHIFAENAFSAGIQSVQGTENINIFQDITSEMSLPDIAQQYQKSAARMRREEQSEDFRCIESAPEMILRSNIEKQAADVYTSAMFKIFQEELRRCLSVKIEEKQSDGKITLFNSVEEGDKREYTVAFNKLDFKITCGCGKFESVGILCVHALKVLNRQNIFDVPHQYILNRWRKDARNRVLMDAAEIADKHVRPLNSTANKLGLELSRILAKSAGNDECLKLVEICFDNVGKQVDKMLKANRMKEHANSKVAEAGDSNAQTVLKLPHPNQNKGSKGKEKESYGGHNHHSDVEEITSEYANYSQAPMFTKSTSASQDSKMSTGHTAKVSRSMSTGSYHFGSRGGMVSKVRYTAAKIIGLGPMGKNKDKTPI